MDNIYKRLATFKLDWSKLDVSLDTGIYLNHEFPISPKQFLDYAKVDIQNDGTRGVINSISNSKRAIDCQGDAMLIAFGFDPRPRHLEAQLAGHEKYIRGLASNKNAPFNLLVLESLGVVTPMIVQKTRRIRNLLEHEYKAPTRAMALDAIDIASLYISACEGKMRASLWNFSLGSGELWVGKNLLEYTRYSLHFYFNEGVSPEIDIHFWDRTRWSKAGFEDGSIKIKVRGTPRKDPKLKVNDRLFYPAWRLFTAVDHDSDKNFVEKIQYFMSCANGALNPAVTQIVSRDEPSQ